MNKLFKSLAVIAVAALTFTSCDDVPMPYNQPIAEEQTEVTPSGTGTADDPYNVAGALQVVNALDAGQETADVIYVKGVVKAEPDYSGVERYGNANYYITDDGNNQIYIFQSYYLGNKKFTADDKLNVGDTVIVVGKFVNYKGNTPETVGRGSSYIYSLNGKIEGGGETPSGEAKGSGTEADPYNAAAANQVASALADGEQKEGVYVKGIISKIDEVNTQYGNAHYYLSEDGSENGAQFEVYRGYYLNGEKFTSEDQIKVGQTVVVKGTLVNFKGNTPEMTTGSQIISLDGQGSTTKPDTPDVKGEGVTIDGTTVTLTNKDATAGSETVSIDLSQQGFENQQSITEITMSDGTKITFDGNGQRNAPKYYNGTKGIRVYLNNVIKFAGIKKIAKIVMECDSYKGKDYVGNAAASVVFDGNDVTYTNSDPSITSGGGVQLRVKTITITYAE